MEQALVKRARRPAPELRKPLAPRKRRSRSLADGWFLALQALAVAVLAAYYAPLRLDIGDEGFMAHGAERVLHGEFPHRDFYSLQGPLSHWLMAGWSALWGLSFLKLRLAGALIQWAAAALTFLIARQAGAGRWAYAAGIGALATGTLQGNFAPLASWQGITFSLLAAWLALRAMHLGSIRLAFGSGVAAALGALCRHEQTVYLIAALAVLALAVRIARRKPRSAGFPLRAWLAGAMAVGVPAFLLCWGAGALPAMWDQLVLFPLTRYADTSALPMPWFDQEGPNGSLLAVVFFRFSPMLAIAAAAMIAWNARRKGFGLHEALGAFLIAFTHFFWLQATTRSDLGHLSLTLNPALALLAWMPAYALRMLDEAQLGATARRCLVPAMHAAAATVFLLFVATIWHTLRPPIAADAVALSMPRAGVRVAAAQASVIEGTVSAIRALVAPEQAVLVLPYHPAYYVLAERRNPTRYIYHWPGDRTPEELAAIVAQTQADPPAAVVVFDRDSTATYLRPVVEWVEANYAPLDTQADPVIYAPRRR